MAENRLCDICGNEAEYRGDGVFHAFQCPRCGTFDYDASLGWRKITSPDEMVRVSGWVREQNSAGFDYARITPEIAARVFQMRLPSLKERSERAFSVLARLCNWQLHVFAIVDTAVDFELQGRTYSRDYDELQTLLLILHNQGYTAQGRDVCQLTVAGLFAAEELCNPRSISSQGFVAMNFGDNLREAWANGFEPAIRAAGFRPFRIDNKDYVGGITDEIYRIVANYSYG